MCNAESDGHACRRADGGGTGCGLWLLAGFASGASFLVGQEVGVGAAQLVEEVGLIAAELGDQIVVHLFVQKAAQEELLVGLLRALFGLFPKPFVKHLDPL